MPVPIKVVKMATMLGVAILGTVCSLSFWADLICNEPIRPSKPLMPSVPSASELSGIVDHIGSPRKYFVGLCNRSYTIPEVYDAFAAHSVEWSILGKTDPWWSVISVPDLKGKVDLPKEQKQHFYASGRFDRDRILRDVRANGSRPLDNASISVLDFGCGVGRLGMAFAWKFADVTCVDQSVFHLQIAQKEWQIQNKRAKDDRTPKGQLNLKVSGPDLLAAVAGKRFDFVYSMIVFQHMIPPLQIVYLEQMCDILKPGGQGWVHIPTMIPVGLALTPCDVRRSMRTGGIQMYNTPKDLLEGSFRSRGCNVTVLERGNAYINPGSTAGIIFFNK
ncbi:ubiG [Symbiodinium natans]|uniref:UbiG protein n=1 Tax=Symbiodinium natans TaxID=878477 RepID=A0A812RHS8_9DINO|nr:ubiG [Symbiodinium natans]